jgi:hypothetical protein
LILPFFSNSLHQKFSVSPPAKIPLNKRHDRSAALLRVKAALIVEWDNEYPKPSYYQYATSTSPQLFLKMSQFTAGRISQMNAHKSYLATHSSWAQHGPSRSPKCKEVDEDFEQAILHCLATEPSCELYIPDITSLDPDSTLWLDNLKLAALAEFIKATRTGYLLSWGRHLQALSSSGSSDILTDATHLSLSYQSE